MQIKLLLNILDNRVKFNLKLYNKLTVNNLLKDLISKKLLSKKSHKSFLK